MHPASPTNQRLDIRIEDLGSLPYRHAYEIQLERHAEVMRARESGAPLLGTVLLLEHDPPVITISRRPDARSHLLASDADLRQAGVEVEATDRGGDITYHGPGQLVAYPIIDLNRAGLRIHAYMRLLEESAIRTLRDFGLRGVRDDGATGVWVDGRKVCAVGVRVRRWISMHGLALNVTTDLRHFDLIVPCGLAGREVTSIERLAAEPPPMSVVKALFTEHLIALLGAHAA
ncbi:MAG: lipoyl(octanoyl) transferase LipB [Planctomycetota bacterium]